MTLTTPSYDQKSSRVGLTINAAQIVKLFGTNNYSGGIFDIAVRELLQNSFDAVRSAQAAGALTSINAHIEIELDPLERRLTVKDNGIGMSAKTLRDVFLCVGKSRKDHLSIGESSGGFGIAKLSFLFAGERIRIGSRYQNYVSQLETTGPELLAGQSLLSSALEPGKSGTTIDIIFPEFVEDVHGVKVPLPFPVSLNSLSTLSSPLIGPVQVTAKYGDAPPVVLPMGLSFPEKEYPILATFYLPGANVVLRQRPENASGLKSFVLSSGLHQFSWQPWGTTRKLIVDVRPTVAADSPIYPFNKQRENWNPSIGQEIKALESILSFFDRLEAAKESARRFSKVKYIDRIDGQYRLSRAWLAVRDDDADTRFSSWLVDEKGAHCRGTCYYESEGKTYVATGRVNEVLSAYDVQPEQGRKLFLSEATEDIIRIAASKSGHSPQQIVDHVGEFTDICTGFMAAAMEACARPPKDKDAVYFGAGIIKNVNGINMIAPYSAVLINPAIYRGKTPGGWAHGWMHTLMHETAHWDVRVHNADFTTSLGELHAKLEDLHPDLYVDTLEKLKQLATRNVTIVKALGEAYDEVKDGMESSRLGWAAQKTQPELPARRYRPSLVRRPVVYALR